MVKRLFVFALLMLVSVSLSAQVAWYLPTGHEWFLTQSVKTIALLQAESNRRNLTQIFRPVQIDVTLRSSIDKYLFVWRLHPSYNRDYIVQVLVYQDGLYWMFTFNALWLGGIR